MLKEKGAIDGKKIERVIFNAITKQAVADAMANPREIDVELVDAYLARRALDYLVGFTLSPVLWRKLPGSRSAGRVQSVALRLVCERELEIEKFMPQEYWSIPATLRPRAARPSKRASSALDGKKIKRLDIGSGAGSRRLQAARSMPRNSRSLRSKQSRRSAIPTRPSPPRRCNRKRAASLALRPRSPCGSRSVCMKASILGGETVGLITYMRTDGIELDPSAITGARAVIEAEYGKKYVPDTPRVYKNKAKNAQEAHEAIRPTDLARQPSMSRNSSKAIRRSSTS